MDCSNYQKELKGIKNNIAPIKFSLSFDFLYKEAKRKHQNALCEILMMISKSNEIKTVTEIV